MNALESSTLFRIWVNHSERIVSFHEVDEFQEKRFHSLEDYKAYINKLQCNGYRFQ